MSDFCLKGHGKQGFSLFELMVAVLLLAMVSVMIYSVLNVGIRFADKGEKRILAMDRRLGLTALLHRQVKSGWYDERKKKVIISTDTNLFRIVTRSPFLYADSGVVLAVYLFEPGDGIIYYLEKRDYYNSDYDDEYVPDIDDMFILMTDVASFSLEYDESSGVVAMEFNGREYEFKAWCRGQNEQDY